jgi:hypothetical protein
MMQVILQIAMQKSFQLRTAAAAPQQQQLVRQRTSQACSDSLGAYTVCCIGT